MSLTTDGFWKAGFWSTSFWGDGFWAEAAGGGFNPVLDRKATTIIQFALYPILKR
jgi:hypothetical protein